MTKSGSGIARSKSAGNLDGFTIVELLIVVVIVAILATLSIIVYGEVKTRAQASAIASDLRATHKALSAYKVLSGTDSWWIDTDAALSGSTAGNPRISTIIAAQPELAKLLKEAPTKNGFNTPNDWFYDNDGDAYGGCSASTAGTSIIIFNPQNPALMQAIDTAVDDGNLSCGTVRLAGGNFIFGID
jgi:prepilin-type N-terminal cleavage/methylation domain-containing protein